MSDTMDELVSNAVNTITEKVSEVMLKEFLALPEDLQLNLVLIKSAQLLLANILCQVAMTKEELSEIVQFQGEEVKEMTYNCVASAFVEKFGAIKH